MLDSVLCALIRFVNLLTTYFLDTISDSLAAVIGILPPLPISFTPIEWGFFGNSVAYFIPIADMLTHFSLILVVVVIWQSIEHILRLLKTIK